MPSLYEKRKLDFSYLDATDGNRPLACGRHMHHHVEVVYMQKGHSGALVESTPYDIVDDCLFVVFPNQIHAYEGVERQEHHLMIVNPDLFPDLSGIFGSYIPQNPIFKNVSQHGNLITLITLIRNEVTRSRATGEPMNETLLRGLGLAFFSALFRVMPMEKKTTGNSSSLRQILDYCARNYNEPLSLTRLGEALHMSKYYISHLFSERFHMSFNDYVNTLRLAEACRYLESTDKNVTEISELVGFGTLRTFNRVFQKHYHLSPTEYRSEREQRKARGDGEGIIQYCPDPKEEAFSAHETNAQKTAFDPCGEGFDACGSGFGEI